MHVDARSVGRAYRVFRDLLVRARHERGLTQADVASRLDRPQSFVSKYERGERRLDLVEFIHIARALDIEPCAFIKELVDAWPREEVTKAGTEAEEKEADEDEDRGPHGEEDARENQ